jgi:amidohydrolase
MMFVGLKGGPRMRDLPLHHPRFLPPDEAVGTVARAQAVAFTAATAKR